MEYLDGGNISGNPRVSGEESFGPPAILDGRYFQICVEDGKVKAVCQLCKNKETIINGTMKSTTNFKTQLKRLHHHVLEEYENYKIENKVSGNRIKRKMDDPIEKKLKQSQ